MRAAAPFMLMNLRVKNHSDELIFHSQGLRRSAANLEIASENSPSRDMKVIVRRACFSTCIIKCSDIIWLEIIWKRK